MTANRFLATKITLILQLFFAFLAIPTQLNSQECDLTCQMLEFKSKEDRNTSFVGNEVPSHQLVDSGGVFYRLDETQPFTGVSIQNKNGSLFKKSFIRDGLVYKTETYNKDGFLVEVLGLEENQETLLVYDDKGSLIIEGYHQIFYDDTRTLKMRGFINDGKPDGPWQTFDKDTNFLGYNFWDEGRKLEVVSFDMIHFYDETVTLRNNSEEFSGVVICEYDEYVDGLWSWCKDSIELFQLSTSSYFSNIAFIKISYGKPDSVQTYEEEWDYDSEYSINKITPRKFSSCDWSIQDENPIFKPCEISYTYLYDGSGTVNTSKYETLGGNLFIATFSYVEYKSNSPANTYTEIIEADDFNEYVKWFQTDVWPEVTPSSTISIFDSMKVGEIEREQVTNNKGKVVSIYKNGFDISNGEEIGVESMFEGYYKDGLKQGLWKGADGSYINFSKGVPDGEYMLFGLGKKLYFEPYTDLLWKDIPSLEEELLTEEYSILEEETFDLLDENENNIPDPIDCLSESGTFDDGQYTKRIIYSCGNIQQIFEYSEDNSINLVKNFDPILNEETNRELYCSGVPYKKLIMDSSGKIVDEEIYPLSESIKEALLTTFKDLDCADEWVSLSDEQERIKQLKIAEEQRIEEQRQKDAAYTARFKPVSLYEYSYADTLSVSESKEWIRNNYSFIKDLPMPKLVKFSFDEWGYDEEFIVVYSCKGLEGFTTAIEIVFDNDVIGYYSGNSTGSCSQYTDTNDYVVYDWSIGDQAYTYLYQNKNNLEEIIKEINLYITGIYSPSLSYEIPFEQRRILNPDSENSVYLYGVESPFKYQLYKKREDGMPISYNFEILNELEQEGERIYERNCSACHQINGEGLVGIFPALAGSDIVMNKKEEHIAILVDGVRGSAMMSFDSYLTDRELAAVMTYTQMAWDNNVEDASAYIFPEDITAYKAKTQ